MLIIAGTQMSRQYWWMVILTRVIRLENRLVQKFTYGSAYSVLVMKLAF